MEDSKEKKNVFGQPLIACCHSLQTGYYRDGYCRTDVIPLEVLLEHAIKSVH